VLKAGGEANPGHPELVRRMARLERMMRDERRRKGRDPSRREIRDF